MSAFFIILMMAFMITLLALPISKKLAFAIGAIDHSSDCLKLHGAPVPLLGGMSIVIGMLGALLISASLISLEAPSFWGFVVATMVITSIGIVDDLINVRPSYKLYMQIVLAVGLVCIGLRTQFFTSPFISIPLTIFYVVGSCNAWNLLDGLDGLAAGIAAIAALCFFVLFLGINDGFGMALSLALSGACIGFLTQNFNPASIFMGDAGSMMIGLAFSVLMIRYSTSLSYQSFFIPILICGVPVFDTALSYVRRLANRKPILLGDRGHFYDHFLAKGYSVKQSVLICYFIGGIFGVSGIGLTAISSTTLFVFSVSIFILLILGASKMQMFKETKLYIDS